MPPEETLTIAIPRQMREQLDAAAEAQAATVGEIVRRAIVDFLFVQREGGE